MSQPDPVSCASMITVFLRNHDLPKAEALFRAMPESQRNIVAESAMIDGYVKAGRVDEARKVFDEIYEGNVYSWTSLISGYFKARQVDEGRLERNAMTKLASEYFVQMPNKGIVAWNAMITAYVDAGNMAQASELFNLMPQRNVLTWNAMIDRYARNGPEGAAMKLLNLMFQSRFMPNETTRTSILTSCEGMLENMLAHALAIRLGLAFERLEAKDAVSWTAMILAYSNHGHGYQVFCLFARMLKSGTKPDEITFVGVLSACSHAGLVEKGRKFFNLMSRAYGQVEEAMRVVSKMPPLERDHVVLGALLGACRLHGDVRMAVYIGERLIELQPSSSGAYVLSANVHAARGEWDEFAQVRKKMERRGKKVASFSQIEVKGKDHVFFVGDRSHPKVTEIYGLLRETLLAPMREMGYVVLKEVD
ncbi:hypothetical protein CUMW_016470 [Citrus unshiu]|nr:hypothetical protein CUMW_016470 [Citrus unshiu]